MKDGNASYSGCLVLHWMSPPSWSMTFDYFHLRCLKTRSIIFQWHPLVGRTRGWFYGLQVGSLNDTLTAVFHGMKYCRRPGTAITASRHSETLQLSEREVVFRLDWDLAELNYHGTYQMGQDTFLVSIIFQVCCGTSSRKLKFVQ